MSANRHVVTASCTCLSEDFETLFDLLGERPELLRQLFEGMFRAGTESATAGESLITSR